MGGDMVAKRDACRILMGKPDGRNFLEGLHLIRWIILKWILNIMRCCGLGSCGWKQGQMAECCGYGNELS